VGVRGGGSEEVREISARDLAARIARGEPTALVDVREPWEHELARIEGSVLIPMSELPAALAELEVPAAEVLVACYCHAGVRSLHAAAFLARHGFPNVASLAGGIDTWSVEVDPRVPRY
jgi:adenylyltransferase/sulfurtransferase